MIPSYGGEVVQLRQICIAKQWVEKVPISFFKEKKDKNRETQSHSRVTRNDMALKHFMTRLISRLQCYSKVSESIISLLPLATHHRHVVYTDCASDYIWDTWWCGEQTRNRDRKLMPCVVVVYGVHVYQPSAHQSHVVALIQCRTYSSYRLSTSDIVTPMKRPLYFVSKLCNESLTINKTNSNCNYSLERTNDFFPWTTGNHWDWRLTCSDVSIWSHMKFMDTNM